MQPTFGGDAFDGLEAMAKTKLKWIATGANRFAVHEHGTRTAHRFSASVLCTGKSEFYPQYIEQRALGVGRYCIHFAVDFDLVIAEFGIGGIILVAFR